MGFNSSSSFYFKRGLYMYNEAIKTEWEGCNTAIDNLKEKIKIGDIFWLFGVKAKRTGDIGVRTPKRWRVIGVYPHFAMCEKINDGYRVVECFLYQDLIGRREV